MTVAALTYPLLAALAVLYTVGIAALARGLRTALRQKPGSTAMPTVSVVIPARNESAVIHRCIASVLAVDYPSFEVVFVDDGSTDDTVAIVDSLFRARLETLPVTVLVRSVPPSARSGKVSAIGRGVEASSGEIIVTIDADCVVRPGWLRAMVASMTDDVGFVAGPVAYERPGSVLRRMEALEFISLIGVGAGAIGLGKPLICNSANAAYRRELYDRMRLPRAVSDFAAADELLMLFVHDSTEFDVAFCPAVEAVVETGGADSVAHFLSQRMRWVAMVDHLPSHYRAALVAAFLFFLLTAFCLLAGFWEPALAVTGLLALALKTFADYRLLSPTCRHFGRADLLRVLPAAEFLYLPYVLFAAPVGVLRQPHWKSRGTADRGSADPRTLPAG